MYAVKKFFFPKTKIGCDDAFDVTECLQQIEIPNCRHICAQCSELPSNTCRKKFFSEKKLGFDDAFDETKCLQQIELPDFLHTCVLSYHLI